MIHLPVPGAFAAELLFWLLAGHFICDFVFQSEWLSDAKVAARYAQVGLPRRGWLWALTAHSFMHASWVFLATGRIELACGELLCHWITDWAKADGWYGFHVDQVIHLIHKLLWLVAVIWFWR